MGYFIAMAVNPNPVANTDDRQWMALDQSGFIMTSHGIAVPTDSPNQPNRGYGTGGGPQNFAVPRFGLAGLYLPGYARDVGRDLVVTDWTQDDPGGYVGDSYGALWPFGQKTPIAPTGETGAPFGYLPLPATQFPGLSGTTINGIQMWSANGKPFGLGGYPNGFGYMISDDGVILNWGGPITALAQPWQNLGGVGLSPDGVPGHGTNCVVDFKVNPDGSGDAYVLFRSGYILNLGPPNRVVSSAQPSPANAAMANGDYRFMHVEWGKWIIAFKADGTPWGYNIGSPVTEAFPPLPFDGAGHPPWWNPSGGPAPGNEGYWQDGELYPPRGPTHIWMIASTGGLGGRVITGNLSVSAVTTSGTHLTTSRPTISWTYTETLNVPQLSFNLRVYPIAVTQAAGFTAGQNAGAICIDLTSATPSAKINVDLVNGAQYKAYVRVTSAAGIQTAWGAAGSTLTWTQNIPAPPQPTSVTATPNQGAYPGLGNVTVVAGGSLPAGALRQFQRSAGGGPWTDVIGAGATTASTVTDPYAPTNVVLAYLVRTFYRTPAVVASPWQLSAGVILQPATGAPPGSKLVDVFHISGTPQYVTIHVQSSSIEGPLELRGEFDVLTLGAKLVTSGGTKGTIHTLKLMLRDGTAANNAIASILSLGRSILYQDIRGSQWWVHARPGNWKQILTNPTVDAREVDIDLVEVVTPTS